MVLKETVQRCVHLHWDMAPTWVHSKRQTTLGAQKSGTNYEKKKKWLSMWAMSMLTLMCSVTLRQTNYQKLEKSAGKNWPFQVGGFMATVATVQLKLPLFGKYINWLYWTTSSEYRSSMFSCHNSRYIFRSIAQLSYQTGKPRDYFEVVTAINDVLWTTTRNAIWHSFYSNTENELKNIVCAGSTICPITIRQQASLK